MALRMSFRQKEDMLFILVQNIGFRTECHSVAIHVSCALMCHTHWIVAIHAFLDYLQAESHLLPQTVKTFAWKFVALSSFLWQICVNQILNCRLISYTLWSITLSWLLTWIWLLFPLISYASIRQLIHLLRADTQKSQLKNDGVFSPLASQHLPSADESFPLTEQN